MLWILSDSHFVQDQELFGHRFKPKRVFKGKNLMPAVTPGGLIVCFIALGTEQLAVIDLTMNPASYQRMLEDNVSPSV